MFPGYNPWVNFDPWAEKYARCQELMKEGLPPRKDGGFPVDLSTSAMISPAQAALHSKADRGQSVNEEMRWLQQLGKGKNANSDRSLEAVPLAIDASDLEKPSDDSKDDFAVKV